MSETTTQTKDPSRVTRSIAFRPDQDLWLTELLGTKGNVSGLFQALTDLAMRGEVDVPALVKQQKDQSALARATAYLRAKEAAMLFEEDVMRCLENWTRGRKGLKVTKSRIHNGAMLFIADVSIEDAEGNVVASVVCKSSPRADRLQLALAEAIIGQQKTGKIVITAVPYFIEESALALSQFKSMGLCVADLKGLLACVEKVIKTGGC
jgi:molybdopterin-binding protein